MIGIMQGRLSPMIDGQIQAFPVEAWKDEFRLANDIGFTHIEWTLDHFNLFDNPLFGSVDEIISLKSETGILIDTLTYDAAMQSPLVQSGKIQTIEVDNIKRVIEQSKKVGIKILVLPLVDNSSMTNGDDAKYGEIFSELENEVLGNGFRIAIESDLEPRNLRSFLTQIRSENIGLNYDTGNSASLGFNFQSEMGLLKEFIINVHLKDRKTNGGTVRFGEGNAPLRTQVNYFRKNIPEVLNVIQGARSCVGDDVAAATEYLKFVQESLD